jgi:hypothetical protein
MIDQAFLDGRDLAADHRALQEDSAEWFAQLIRDHHEHMSATGVAVVAVPPVPASCPRCGGTLISEVSDPLSARCTACAEPIRRIT